MPVNTAILPPGMQNALIDGERKTLTSHFQDLARSLNLKVWG